MKPKKYQLNRRIFIKGAIVGLLFFLGFTLFKEKIALAASGEESIATATPYYRHPVTGIVEDAGNNEGIGQGMTESVLHSEALIEKTIDERMYVTVRYFLAEYISEVKFWTQENLEAEWVEVSYQIMQENLGGEYCTDYRFKIPSEDVIVRSSFFVAPMGRAVIFYMNFSNLTSGSGDFIITANTETTRNNGSTLPEEIEEVTVTTMAKSSAAELITSAQGLTLSGEYDRAANKSHEKTVSTEGDKTGQAVFNTDENYELPGLSWKLFWQCILIITLPGILVGTSLLGMIFLLRKRERLHNED
jgi:hypothetical protein